MEMQKKINIQIDEEKSEAERRIFKSGRKGYGYYGDVYINGIRHRVSLNIVEVD